MISAAPMAPNFNGSGRKNLRLWPLVSVREAVAVTGKLITDLDAVHWPGTGILTSNRVLNGHHARIADPVYGPETGTRHRKILSPQSS
jgi:hypothetical protein